MIERRSDRGGRDRLKGHLAGVVVETNFEPVEHSRAAEKIKPDTETLGETDRCSDLYAADLDRKIVNESGNIATVANDDHLMPASAPIDADSCRFVDGQHAKRRARVHKNPEPVPMEGDR
jgi:hypothetical protein